MAQLRPNDFRQPIGTFARLAEQYARCKVIAAGRILLQVTSVGQRQQNAEQGRFRQPHARAEFFEIEKAMLIGEEIEEIERTSNGFGEVSLRRIGRRAVSLRALGPPPRNGTNWLLYHRFCHWFILP